jgi:phosphatidate phosphatase APP1
MLIMWPILLTLALPVREVQSDIASDEVVDFYPTYARRTDDGENWLAQVHGSIFEPEEDSLRRAALIGLVRRSLGLDGELPETALLRERLRAFLVDNERDKTIYIQLGKLAYRVGVSDPNGHFSGSLSLKPQEVSQLIAPGPHTVRRVSFTAVTPADDDREFRGEFELIEPEGVSVISDVDDTIKVSEVTDHEKLLRNTFLREFKSVDGMAALYQQLAARGAVFHYVSASPWQLYRPLSQYMKKDGFPAGSLHMKYFRLKDRSALQLLASQHKYKPPVIEKILADFPKRTFILVGDSGEQDPEIYGELARKFPRQIAKILIRDVQDLSSYDERFNKSFAEVPRERWKVTTSPEKELPWLLEVITLSN